MKDMEKKMVLKKTTKRPRCAPNYAIYTAK